MKEEAIQAVIETTMAPKRAGQNPATVMPSSIQATSENMPALMTSRNRPSVRIVSGRVRMIRTGRTTALTMPSSRAAQNSDQPSAISTPGTIAEATQRPMATMTTLMRNPRMPPRCNVRCRN